MSRNKIIAISLGGLAAAATFIAGMWMMIFGAMFPQSDVLFAVSLAISPLAVVAVVVGYLVWWVCLFLLTLLWVEPNPESNNEADHPGP